MTQEEKQLLIKDLCARLPYGLKVNIERDFPNNPQIVERVAKDGEIIVNGILAYDIYYYKPYLRPMGSMTEKEREEYRTECKKVLLMRYRVNSHYPVTDWLNEHHFDFRGLIEKGLALEASKGVYKTD